MRKLSLRDQVIREFRVVNYDEIDSPPPVHQRLLKLGDAKAIVPILISIAAANATAQEYEPGARLLVSRGLACLFNLRRASSPTFCNLCWHPSPPSLFNLNQRYFCGEDLRLPFTHSRTLIFPFRPQVRKSG